MHSSTLRRFASVLVLLGTSAACTSARADGLTGTSVAGLLTPNSTFGATVTQQFASPITIGSASSFQGTFSIAAANLTFDVNALVSATGLIVQIGSPSAFANALYPGTLYTLLFTNPAFTGTFEAANFSCATDPYGTCALAGNGLTSATLSNGTLALTFQNAAAGQVYDFAYIAASTAATPEPASLVLTGTALLGMAGAVRRRFAR